MIEPPLLSSLDTHDEQEPNVTDTFQHSNSNM